MSLRVNTSVGYISINKDYYLKLLNYLNATDPTVQFTVKIREKLRINSLDISIS